MPRVIYFEIQADDTKRATEFYKKVFDWEFTKYENREYFLAKTGEKTDPGINGAILDRQEHLSQNVCTIISVPSIDEYLKKIEKFGGKVMSPKISVSKKGYMAYCSDSEDNLFGLRESNPEAE